MWSINGQSVIIPFSHLFKIPFSMTYGQGQIYLTDWGLNTIRSFGLQGTVMTELTSSIDDLDKPMGVCYTPVHITTGTATVVR